MAEVPEVEAFGPYDLCGLIGRGGMGEVHRAWHREQRREVAVKVLSASRGDSAEFAERFRRESHAAAVLSNPHVIPIHAFGEIDGRLFLEMRLVEGDDLGRVLAARGPLPLPRALAVLEQAADALDAAHAHGLVHRDVKPSNLLLTPSDFVYLVDFGIAHTTGTTTAGTPLTAAGATIGTLAYMAPERFLDQPTTPAVDVYALACVLHELLVGRPPFVADGAPGLLHAHLYAAPPSLVAQRPDLPAALDDVLAAGMAKEPERRPRTAGALVAAARRAAGGGARVQSSVSTVGPAPVGAPWPVPAPPRFAPPPPPPSPRTAPPVTREHARAVPASLLVALGALAAIVLVLGAVVLSGASPGSAGADQAAPPTTTTTTTAPGPSGSTAPGSSTGSSPVGSPSTGSSATGDLGLAQPISSPACDGSLIVVVRSATEPATYRTAVREALAQYPGAQYLLTADSCASLAPRDDDGTAIYAVYLGPFTSRVDACAARAAAGGDSYLRRLDQVSPVGETIPC